MPPEAPHRVRVTIDRLLAESGMTVAELADRVGVTPANLTILKNNRARAIRFSTLTALCDVLGCTPGDILTITPAPRPNDAAAPTEPGRQPARP